MKDYIDRLTHAQSDLERRHVTRDLLGMHDLNWGSVGSGWIAGKLILRGIGDLFGGGDRRGHYSRIDDYSGYED